MAKILIAEDDEKIAQLEKDYLESNGYENGDHKRRQQSDPGTEGTDI